MVALAVVPTGEAVGSSNDNQSPYTDHDLTRIQAEDFDIGGEGVAYHDTSSGNNGNVYRDTDVDIQETEDDSGEYNIGWISRSEWWEYTVDVPEDGEYTLQVRLAGENATSLEVAIDGSSVATIDVPNTGGWQEWTTVEAGTVELSAGTRTIRLTANGGHFNINWVGFNPTNTDSSDDEQPERTTSSQESYTDHDLTRIQAEDFDIGGEGVAYHDTSSGNNGNVYRDTDVDIQETEDDSGEYNIGWINRDEWWEYTVDVPEDGEYDLTARLAGQNGTSLDVAIDGSSVATIDVPNTGGWQEWTTVEAGTVELSAGTRTIRLTANGGMFNTNWVGFKETSGRVQVPAQSDWTDHGSIFQPSTDNWDARLVDCDAPCALIKHDGRWLLYYVAAEPEGRPEDDGPVHRRVGVLENDDITNHNGWTRHPDNPIIEHIPSEGKTDKNGNDFSDEEGLMSGAVINDNGTVRFYAGAMTAISATAVNADGKLYTANDGINFSPQGTVLDHDDNSLVGNGDEIFPTAARKIDGTWYVWYMGIDRDANIAYGDSPMSVDQNSETCADGSNKEMAIPQTARLDDERLMYLLLTGPDNENQSIEIGTLNHDDLTRLSPIDSYDFGTVAWAGLYRHGGTWYMPYMRADLSGFGMMTAPVETGAN